jgi:hypothetical protein
LFPFARNFIITSTGTGASYVTSHVELVYREIFKPYCLQELEKKEKARIKQRKLAIQKRKAEVEEIQLSDNDDDDDESASSESEEEVVEVGRANSSKSGKAGAPAAKQPAKLAPIFMASKPKVILSTVLSLSSTTF